MCVFLTWKSTSKLLVHEAPSILHATHLEHSDKPWLKQTMKKTAAFTGN